MKKSARKCESLSKKSKIFPKDIGSEPPNTQLDIVGRRFPVSKPLKRLIEEKSKKLFLLRIRHIHVAISQQKNLVSVKIVASEGQESFKATSSHENVYTAVIEAFHKVHDSVDRHCKQKHKEHKQRPSFEYENAIDDYDIPELPITETDNGFVYLKTIGRLCPHHKIVSRQKMKVKTFTQEEAIMQMEVGSDPTMLFFGEDDRKIKIIYRIGDGNYGIIESEGYFSLS
ncbi:MAG: sigma 54 modulation/S30EA ribosomal C-terminal domain-containing protein [Victivallaceae bacterium]